MAALTGNSIDSSYQGLIKTTDNGAITGTAKAVTDGLGNATNIEISNTATNFVSGTVDFTGSTVSGLPGGSAGLVTGGQTNSMKSDASLTTTAAVTSHEGDIVIGEDAESKVSSGTDDYNEGGAIAIGVGATVDKVVDYNFADTKGGIALGINAKANSGVNEGGSIAMGENSKAEGTSSSIAIGSDSFSRASFDISIGHGANTTGTGIAIGKDAAAATNGWGIAIGESAGADAGGFRNGAIAIGANNSASATDAIAIGNESSATADSAVALGHNVTAGTANTVSVSALETQTDGGVSIKGDGTNAGKLKLFCEDASGAHNVTLEGPAHSGGSTYSLKFPNTQSAGSQILEADSSGNLSWINTPGGGGGSAGLENGTGTDSLQSAAALTTNAADAAGNYSIALGDGASATRQESVAIGQNATADGTGSDGSIAIGNGAVASNNRSVVIGVNNSSSSSEGIAIGDDVDISGSDRSVGVGNSITLSGGSDKVAIGTSAAVTGNRGLAFGQNASATANESVAIGYNVTAANAETVSVKALETQTNSTPTAGGVIISDASGTDQRLNVTADGNLQLGTTRMGIVGWATAKVSETQATSSCDTTRSSVKIPAGTVKAGDILQIKSLEQRANSNGFTYSNIAIHTAGTIGQAQSGAFVTNHQSSSDGFGVHSKTLFVQTVDGTGDGTQYLEDSYNPMEQSGGIVSSNLGNFTAIDWTVDQYLCVNVCIDNNGATWTNYGASLTIIGRA